MNRLLVALAVLGGLGISGMAAEPKPAKFGELAVGAKVPDFEALDPEGKPWKLSDCETKVVVLTLTRPNRPPSELLELVFSKHQAAGVAVVAVCADAPREEFRAWQAKHRGTVSYSLAWDPAAKNAAESIGRKIFGLGVYPATVVIGCEGKLVGGFVGFGGSAREVLHDYLRAAGVAIPAEEGAKPAAPPRSEDRLLQPGAMAPDFTNLNPDGAPVKLADFAGKIVVLDFWATWCGPCLNSLPHTQDVAAATKTQGVIVLAACTSDTRARFAQWVKENREKYPDLVFGADPKDRDSPPAEYAERASVKLYGVTGIPAQFVIDRDGKITEVIRGYRPGDTRLEEALTRLGVRFDRIAAGAKKSGP